MFSMFPEIFGAGDVLVLSISVHKDHHQCVMPVDTDDIGITKIFTKSIDNVFLCILFGRMNM